jgi:hypothetical protein
MTPKKSPPKRYKAEEFHEFTANIQLRKSMSLSDTGNESEDDEPESGVASMNNDDTERAEMIIEPDEKNERKSVANEVSATTPIVDKCKIHDSPLFIYCSVDKICICLACMGSKEHSMHSFLNIDTIYAVHREEVKVGLGKVKDYVQGLASIASQVKTNIAEVNKKEEDGMKMVKHHLQCEAEYLKSQKVGMKYDKLVKKRNAIVNLSRQIKAQLDGMRNTVSKMTEAQLIVAKCELMAKAYSAIARPLKELAHRTVECEFNA